MSEYPHTPIQVGLCKTTIDLVSRWPLPAPAISVAIDGGGHVFVTLTGNLLAKLRISDGEVLWVVPTVNAPANVRYDGTRVWVVGYTSNAVQVHDPRTGLVLALIAVGTGPEGIAFNDRHALVPCQVSGNLYLIDRQTYAVLSTFGLSGVGGGCCGICFDGEYFWVTDPEFTTSPSTPKVYKMALSHSAGLWSLTPVGTALVDTGPMGVTCDIEGNIWVVCGIGGTSAVKVRASDCAWLGSFEIGPGGRNLWADNESVWVAVSGSGTPGSGAVVRLNLDGTIRQTTLLPSDAPRDGCFDGAFQLVALSNTPALPKL